MCFFLAAAAYGQVVVDGRIAFDRWPGAAEKMYFPAIYCFANLDGSASEGRSFRTWETEPPGWYRFSGSAGNYTFLFSQPAYFMRPVVMNNVFAQPDEKLIGLPVRPQFDFHCFAEKEWDSKPARAYYQLFDAKGKSVTSVGFKLATDGVDGFGPKSQNLHVSIHRRGPGTPDRWPQVGPTLPVLDVDCGGAKNYTWSAGWNSGEVPLVAGETYAVCLAPEQSTNSFQAFWRTSDTASCYRVATNGAGFEKRQLWMGIGTDSDSLLIPYNKRIQKQFEQFAGFANRWSQTYIAQGGGLAGVILYAAVGGAQPPLNRQRVKVRVRQGGLDGPLVGIEKIAVGNGNYTGDASWGVFGVAFAPGEVPLTPGNVYGVEFESIENYETIHGFVNIKGQVSDDRAGFNPYRKHPRDPYEDGTSFKNGTEAQQFDLDMQIVEYAEAPKNFSLAVQSANLLKNGDFAEGALDSDIFPAAQPVKQPTQLPEGVITAWKKFSSKPGTMHSHVVDVDKTNAIARVFGVGKDAIDGGFVQRMDGLSRFETYRLSGRIRPSWPTDFDHQAAIGYDVTGQDENPKSDGIVWITVGNVHGVWESFQSQPIRPTTNAISIWLRARSKGEERFGYKADFDDVTLQKVRKSVRSDDR